MSNFKYLISMAVALSLASASCVPSGPKEDQTSERTPPSSQPERTQPERTQPDQSGPKGHQKVMSLAEELKKTSGSAYDAAVTGLKAEFDKLDDAHVVLLSKETKGDGSFLQLLSKNRLGPAMVAMVKKVVDAVKADAAALVTAKGHDGRTMLETIVDGTRVGDDDQSVKELIVTLADAGADIKPVTKAEHIDHLLTNSPKAHTYFLALDDASRRSWYRAKATDPLVGIPAKLLRQGDAQVDAWFKTAGLAELFEAGKASGDFARPVGTFLQQVTSAGLTKDFIKDGFSLKMDIGGASYDVKGGLLYIFAKYMMEGVPNRLKFVYPVMKPAKLWWNDDAGYKTYVTSKIFDQPAAPAGTKESIEDVIQAASPAESPVLLAIITPETAFKKIVEIKPDGTGQDEAYKEIESISKVPSLKKELLSELMTLTAAGGHRAIQLIVGSKATKTSLKMVRLLAKNIKDAKPFGATDNTRKTAFDILLDKARNIPGEKSRARASLLGVLFKKAGLTLKNDGEFEHPEAVNHFINSAFRSHKPKFIKDLMNLKSVSLDQKAALRSAVIRRAVEIDRVKALKKAQLDNALTRQDPLSVEALALRFVLANKGADFGFPFDSNDTDFRFKIAGAGSLKSGTLAEMVARQITQAKWEESNNTAMDPTTVRPYLYQWGFEAFKVMRINISDPTNWESYVKKTVLPLNNGTGKSAVDVIEAVPNLTVHNVKAMFQI